MKFSTATLWILVSSSAGVGHAFSPVPKGQGVVVQPASSSPTRTRTRTRTTSTTSLNDLKKLEWKSPSEEKVEKWLKSYGETSRPTRRDVFTAADWVKSRRPERFIETVLTTFDSSLTQVVFQEVAIIGGISTFTVLYNDLVSKGFDLLGTHYEPIMSGILPLTLPLAPFNLCSGALGLLLTFRTNVSYGRWNEARTAWGKVINDSRSIARMGCTWAKSYKNISSLQLQLLGEAICSFSRSLMNRTLPPQEDAENFKKYCLERLTDQEYANLLINAKHKPTCALAQITAILVEMELNPLHQVEVERVITGLCDALGASERIFTSPVPTFYPRFAARFLAWWLIFLPLALYDVLGNTWNHTGVIPVAMVLSGFLLGIEELATEMEEPFSILPMEKMCEGSIRISVMEQVERSKNGIQSGFFNDGWAPDTLNPNGVPAAVAAVAVVAQAPPVVMVAPAVVAAAAPPAAAPAPGNEQSIDQSVSSFEAFLRSKSATGGDLS